MSATDPAGRGGDGMVSVAELLECVTEAEEILRLSYVGERGLSLSAFLREAALRAVREAIDAMVCLDAMSRGTEP